MPLIYDTMKQFLKNALLALVSVSLVLLAAEILLRFTPVVRFQKQVITARAFYDCTKTHPRWGWAFKPGLDVLWNYTGSETVTIINRFRTIPVPGNEEYGMRDEGLWKDAPKRVLVKGDSFTFGATVNADEIWLKRLSGFPGVYFINAAMGGGILKAVREYRDIRDTIPHDAVIYEMWMGNEFMDNAYFPESFKPTRDNMHKFYQYHTLWSDKLVIMAALNPLKEKMRHHYKKFMKRWGFYSQKPGQGVESPGIGKLVVKSADPILLSQDPENEIIREGMAQTEKNLGELKRLAEEKGKPLIVFLFPFKEQIYFDRIPEALRPKADPLEVNKAVLAMCERQSVRCFDLYDAIYAQREEKLYWDVDVHFTPAGQAAAARAVEQILKREKFLE